MFALLRDGTPPLDLRFNLWENRPRYTNTADVGVIWERAGTLEPDCDGRRCGPYPPLGLNSLPTAMAEANRILDDTSRFNRIRSIDTSLGPVNVYTRRRVVTIFAAEGFAPTEGPYPTSGLPKKSARLAPRADHGLFLLPQRRRYEGPHIAHRAPGLEPDG